MHTSLVKLASFAIFAVTIVGGPTGPRVARACGGFFCSRVPIDQSAEQIVFALSPNHVTAHIQISYTGKAEDFSWVVPVLAKPTISLGTAQIFTTLSAATRPQFRVQYTAEAARCQPLFPPSVGNIQDASSSGDAASPVQVIEEKEVGPYKTVVLEATDSEALVKWLAANGYDQPPTAADLIKHYVDLKMLFVALKLKRNADVGDIQPLVLDMDQPDPCVPLILTRVAALPNMPILVYVLGSHRAAPKNWFEVEVNLRKLNWLTGGANYLTLATAAVDEAKGRAFITEFSGSTTPFRGALYLSGRFNLEVLRPLGADPVAVVRAIMGLGLPADTVLMGILRAYVPMPDSVKQLGVSEQQFYNSIESYRTALAGTTVDTDALIAAIDERVVQPLRGAQAMLDAHTTLTRLFTTVSPEEMTRDPLFHLNSDLPPVSNLHVAKIDGTCSNNQLSNIAVTIDDADTFKLSGPITFNGPWLGAASEPAASRIALVGPAGPPTVFSRGQATAVDEMLNTTDPEIVRTATIPESDGGAAVDAADAGAPIASPASPSGCGCEVGRPAPALAFPGAWSGLVLFGLLRLRRRRR